MVPGIKAVVETVGDGVGSREGGSVVVVERFSVGPRVGKPVGRAVVGEGVGNAVGGVVVTPVVRRNHEWVSTIRR